MKIIYIILFFLLLSVSAFSQNEERSLCSDKTPEDYEKSILYFSQKLLADSSDFSAYYNIGMSYYKLLNYSKALEYFDLLINLNPDYPGAFANRGIIRLLKNQKAEACYDFRQSITRKHNPKAINGMTLRKWCRENCNGK